MQFFSKVIYSSGEKKPDNWDFFVTEATVRLINDVTPPTAR